MDPVKVRFALDRDEDGWPPAESEGLWARPLGDERYRIDNTPWFVRGTSADDVIQALPDPDGTLWFAGTVEASGRQTIRVIPRRDGPLGADVAAVLDAFAPLGVMGEGYGANSPIVALDVGTEVDLVAVKSLCVRGEEDGWWYFEEGSVTQEWREIH
ncbi:DUF4265 domain-containing protein [Cellulomonas sp.]|uniref:DUF4265 domain-containing protein n=1 Tax=Cellulomonas sp. TaxID=40001 RepID=UPI00258E22E0|nr:DUF4265 domain-containing protein [Cellulomonas sp.]MCR6689588.1 DUF4265 domain-containing protein [Cellulomonas sp.]